MFYSIIKVKPSIIKVGFTCLENSLFSQSIYIYTHTYAACESLRLDIAKKRTWKTGTPEKPSSEIPAFSISYTQKKKSLLIYTAALLR
jgi:hypothetical protein